MKNMAMFGLYIHTDCWACACVNERGCVRIHTRVACSGGCEHVSSVDVWDRYFALTFGFLYIHPFRFYALQPMHQLQLLLSLLIYSSLVGMKRRRREKMPKTTHSQRKWFDRNPLHTVIRCVHKRFIKYIGFKQRLKRTPNGCLKFQN